MDALNVITLAQAKLWLKIDPDYDDDDLLIESLIKAAVNQVQEYTLQMLYLQVLSTYTDIDGKVKLYQYPIITIDDILNGLVYETFEETKTNSYTLVEGDVSDRQLVTFTAGYGWTYDGGTEVPDDILTALKQFITYLYENRDDPKIAMPAIVQLLLGPYRRITLF